MSTSRKLQLLALHFGLGYLCINVPVLSDAWAVLVLLVGTNQIILSQNKTGLAHKYAFYIIGLELLFRNFNLFLPYEFGKYSVIYFLLLGRSLEPVKHKTPPGLAIYFLCLLPSIILVDLGSLDENRKEILFNLSGPAELFIAGLYFYNRRISIDELKQSSFWLLCALMVIFAAIYYKIPALDNINFTLSANYQTSGGFGPNQVSSILGLGVVILGLGFIFDYSITGNKIVDSALIMLFAVFGLLTFSRGGMISAILALAAGYAVSLWTNKKQRTAKGFALVVLFSAMMLGAWEFVDDKSGNVLEKRYKGETMETETIGRYSTFTGRDKLAQIDYNIFMDNIMLGVGPGMATYLRTEYGYHELTAAHTELTRLLAEHGILGMLALIILVCLPVIKFLGTPEYKPLNKIILIVFYLLAITTMTHAAMRTAMVGFFYGLAFIDLREDEPEIESEEEETSEGETIKDDQPSKFLFPA